MDYFKNRPFLVINTIHRPSPSARTERKGWADDKANWSTEEKATVVDRLSTKIRQTATVIIDIKNASVVCSRYSNDHDGLLAHYLSKYGDELKRAIALWNAKQPTEAPVEA